MLSRYSFLDLYIEILVIFLFIGISYAYLSAALIQITYSFLSKKCFNFRMLLTTSGIL